MGWARRVLLVVTVCVAYLWAYMAILWAPRVDNFTSEHAQRIFYLHVPAAWAMYLAFGITFSASVWYLRSRDPRADAVAGCSAEVGMVLGTIALITPTLWAREEWGVYWRWEDAKLTITFVLWLFYLGYLVARTGVRVQEDEARLSAVLGVIGFALVPLSFGASRYLESLHPNPIANPSSGGLAAEVSQTLLVGVVLMTLLYLVLLLHRLDLKQLEITIEDLRDRAEAR